MTNILEAAFTCLIFPGGLFPLALGLCVSFVIILAGFGLWDITSRYALWRIDRTAMRGGGETVATRRLQPAVSTNPLTRNDFGGQHD